MYAFADAFEWAYYLKYDLQKILATCIPLDIFTDSKSFFEVTTKCPSTEEKHLMIDTQNVRKAFEVEAICHIGLTRSEHNPCVSFPETKNCPALKRLFHEISPTFPVGQGVYQLNETFREPKI